MLNWFKRHKLLMLIAAIVLAICVIISISYIRGDLGIFSRGIQSANAAVQRPFSSAVNGAESGLRGIFRFKAVVRENDELKDRISELEKEIIEKELQRQELEELRELARVLNYDAVLQGMTPVTADIVAMDNSDYFNIFTINRGTESGISKDCIVVTGKGLVGRILECGNGYAKVITVIDEVSKISFQTLRDMSIMGIVEGDGNGNLVGYTLDADLEIIEGDVLITSGIGMFSEGIEIGTVTSITYNQDTQLKTIEVEPTVSFKSLKKVTVLI